MPTLTARAAALPAAPVLARWTSQVDAMLRTAAAPGDSMAGRMTSYHLGWTDADGAPASAGGKHVRSNLCCWAAEACGGAADNALPAAAAIELVHNFTLVHDDIQDGDHARRGRPTVWRVWGVGQAINAGDVLFARACRTLVGPEAIAAAPVVLDATAEVIEGQCLDLEYERRPDAGLATYLRIVQAKTGALIGASLEAGAAVAGAGAEVRARLRRAGRLLGIAFQLRDDWLGVWGETAVTGKSRQSDLERRKLTHPVVTAYELAGPPERQRLVELFRVRGRRGEPELRTMLDQLGVAEITAQAAVARAKEAVAEVRRCSFDPAHREEFQRVAEYVAERTS